MQIVPTYTFSAIIGGFGTISITQTVGRLSPGARIVSVLVNTVTPFTGYSEMFTLGVGTASDVDHPNDEEQNDLKQQVNM